MPCLGKCHFFLNTCELVSRHFNDILLLIWMCRLNAYAFGWDNLLNRDLMSAPLRAAANLRLKVG